MYYCYFLPVTDVYVSIVIPIVQEMIKLSKSLGVEPSYSSMRVTSKIMAHSTDKTSFTTMTSIFIAPKILFDKEFVPFAKFAYSNLSTKKMLIGHRFHENIFLASVLTDH